MQPDLNRMSQELIKALSLSQYDKAMKIILKGKYELIADKKGCTALHYAAQSDDGQAIAITRALLEAGANPNYLNKEKKSPLHVAVIANAYSQVRLLIQAGASADMLDKQQYLPIDYAEENQFARIYNLLDKEYDDEIASDTDSEDANDYEFFDEVEQRLSELSLDEKSDEQTKPGKAIAHFRGIHFYQEYANRRLRKESINVHRQQNSGTLPRTGLYSCATHQLAGEYFSFPEGITEELLLAREAVLKSANEGVITSMADMQESGQVTPCLGRGEPSRKNYSSRIIEFIQRYVNSYKTLKEDMEAAPAKKIDGRSTVTTRAKWQTLKNLGFTQLPFVSTSESIYWGLEYATALPNWDKLTTHQPVIKNVTALSPAYNADGHPRFPYLGVLYVTLHTYRELMDSSSARILDLFADNEIDTKCCSPGGHITGGYIKARERVFVGGIEKEHVKLSLVIRVPSFYHEYRPFIQEKYGMNEIVYNNFKYKLGTYGHLNYSGMMRNMLEFNRTQQEIIEFVVNSQTKKIEQTMTKLAQSEGLTWRYLSARHGFVSNILPDLKHFVEKRASRP